MTECPIPTCIPRWNDVEATVFTSFQSRIHVVCFCEGGVWPGSLPILNESLTYWARLLNLLLAILCFFFASRLHLADILFVSPCLKMCFCYFLSLKNSFFRNSEHSTTLILIYEANQIEKKNSRILIFLICFVFSSPNPGASPLGISWEITSYNWWHKPPLIGL